MGGPLPWLVRSVLQPEQPWFGAECTWQALLAAGLLVLAWRAVRDWEPQALARGYLVAGATLLPAAALLIAAAMFWSEGARLWLEPAVCYLVPLSAAIGAWTGLGILALSDQMPADRTTATQGGIVAVVPGLLLASLFTQVALMDEVATLPALAAAGLLVVVFGGVGAALAVVAHRWTLALAPLGGEA